MDAPQESEDESMRQKFFAIMAIWECNQAVFRHLRRRHLKRLRLTCRTMDDLVASEAFMLFSDVFISNCMKDLVELRGNISSPPPGEYRHYFQEYENHITGEGLDFRILMQSLARFPLLHHVEVQAGDARLRRTWAEQRWQPDPRRDDTARQIANGSINTPPCGVLPRFTGAQTTLLIDVPFSLFEVLSDGHGITNRLFQDTSSFIVPAFQDLLLRFKPHENIHLSSLRHVFQQAKTLKRLIVSFHEQHREWLPTSLGWLLPGSTSLKGLTLENMVFSHEEFETVLLPWCFAQKVKVLCLDHCAITPLAGADPTVLFTRYADRDVYEDKIFNEIPPQRVRFLDLVFPNSDLEKHDPTWLPSAEDLLAEQRDTESDEEDEFTAWLNGFHLDENHAHSHSHIEEPVPIRFELPMRRLKGREARMIPPTWKGNLGLQFSGEDWGCEPATRFLLMISSFTIRRTIVA
ncbi:hypothetical protein BDW69DRAFT_182068 [Aspergillus filifer]